jgi:hypothetical protein
MPQWIAERVLVRSDDIGGRILVRLGIPEIEHPHDNWRCPFMIEGLGDDSIHYGRSSDSMGAIQNVYRSIRNRLLKSGIPLRWEGAKEDYTGFPKELPWEFGLAFYHKTEKMIDTETAAFIREQTERSEAQHKARKKPPKKTT